MKVLAVTCCTGREDLCKMTEKMVLSLIQCFKETDCEWSIVVVAQGVANPLLELKGIDHNVHTLYVKKNEGFARGMNRAVEFGLRFAGNPDFVLCLNNDLSFPDELWLSKLLKESSKDRVCSPVTDKTSRHPHACAKDVEAIDVWDLAAYCWLIPMEWIAAIRKEHGFGLFSPEFGLGGCEDNWTAMLFRMMYGPDIFRLVPRAWIKHKWHRTMGVVKPNLGAPRRLLAQKIKEALADKGRTHHPDVRQTMERYLKLLR